jgi:trehalose-phosphatase
LRITRPDKGDAIDAILQELGSSVPVAFLGDDLTDEDAFESLQGHGLPILVRPEYRETKASAWIRPPEELIGFFERWLRGISA